MTAWTIAREEWRMAMRSKWLFSFALLFTLLAFIILFFGSQNEFAGFNRTTASLLNLSLFLIPLLTLLIGGLLFSGEKEDGRLALFMTYPISSLSVMAGKFIGLFLSLASVLLIGYGFSYILLSAIGETSFSMLALFLGLSLLLMMMYLSIALFIGSLVSSRLMALGSAIFTWAFFVLFYEFIIMGLVTVTPPAWTLGILSLSVFLNPVELIRVFTIIFLGSGTIFGPSIYDFTIWAESSAGTMMFAASCLAWTIIPIFIANTKLKRGRNL
ncbi:Cu-processing system permease protein [Bacillus ectoiniformans]|uniref:ABC transporter permease n=1 Tax=Bacillus ectoiniformans TaxID=1494429 RepID=UPI001957BB0F|nr:ABC transporter permease subunit [Bacillus ectoiniformans]MBM7649772.1 Cu-processing system permease protein [Bacillus ectoiniformans]